MPLPIDMVLVRHGESESNYANKADRRGDTRLLTQEHLARHSSTYRLTDLGIKQAKAAGHWLRENTQGFDYCLTSAFARAQETAAYLNLPRAAWEVDPYLVERDHGELEGLKHGERVERFGANYASDILHSFYKRPPNGESRLDLGLRWDRIMLSLSQRHEHDRVIIVAHETIIECGLIRRLHWTVDEFFQWKEQNDPATKIHNCQIIHFTRRNLVTGQIISHVRWWRTICPWDLTITNSDWQPIVPRRFNRRQLLDQVAKYPRLINGDR